jgi:hypothetical protein
MKLTTVIILASATLAVAGNHLPECFVRDRIDEYYNGNAAQQDAEIRQLLLQYLRDPQPTVIIVQPLPTPRPLYENR